MENVGSAAVTATFNEIENADVAIVIGANPTENHPVAATYFKQFSKRGGKLIVMDPRGQALKRHSSHMLQFRPGADVSMLNAIMNVILKIITEGYINEEFIANRTEGFEAFKEEILNIDIAKLEQVSGVDRNLVKAAAIAYAKAPNAMSFHGLGVTEQEQGSKTVINC